MHSYLPHEFTLVEYEKLLQLAVKNFPFKTYTELNTHNRFVVWRHDVDMSLQQAVTLARIEARQQVQATYFIHLHNDFYNALDFAAQQLIREIIAAGHRIGLHFDAAYYHISSAQQLVYWLNFEKHILENLFEQKLDVFSFHNPDEFTLSFRHDHYAGMINTYSGFFRDNVSYCSDSNGYWRYEKLLDVLNDKTISRLQVLTHPEWWTEDALMPREKAVRYAEQSGKRAIVNYDRILKAAGRVNIS
ncbi:MULTISPECIES: polysaccharide deacetylase family protein [Legionella]|uniref:Uncharacterized protein n=1 Tax=Legionella septentrionalis TaxID=2498109 RepID=A0A3S0XTM6_9GAMM|nr:MULTISPECIES: hypothetical protein [Legionella]MCP0914349.1 hypothetical protein [Legionella sp. 27cVA30]RUQ88991.1 hypothetical protein EKM59_04125 [Legionella septentrionalis]RUR00298.1 hypothetical protein ELY11_02830 [Legionella septentrionalis]RUR11845.1 hypothetical protein ELY14_00965 [Legionella septentrionalis]RUR17532.1 hypothetical protein ELY10_00960 [Legionella septentrionalis]